MERERVLTEFFDRMGAMRRLLCSAQAFGTATKGMPTRAQFGVMVALAHEQRSVKDLASAFCMTSSAVTQVVNGLVQEKLLVRTVDKTDRRKIAVSLTKKGEALLARAKKARHASLRKLLAPLNDNEIRQLHAIQEKVIAHLDRL